MAMAPNNHSTSTINGHPSRQEGLDIDLERKEGDSKSQNYWEIASEGMSRQKRSDNNPNDSDKRSQNRNKKRKTKRRRLDINIKPSSRSRCVIPEARVNQGYNECAYISGHEHEEDEEEMEYLPRRVRRSGVVMHMSLRHRHDIPQPQPQPQDGLQNQNIASSLIETANGSGSRLHLRRSLSRSARCYCFNCW